MKLLIRIILLMFCALPFAGTTSAQEKPVVIDGNKYYIHTVEKGHTLYAISKKYSVDIAYIIRENPNAANGVKVGDRLRIPVDRIDKEMAKNPAPAIQNDFLIHTVSKKETVYSICKRYNIESNDLVEANPKVTTGLYEGMTLKIPVQKAKFTPTGSLMPADDGTAIIHKVQKQETLYSLSRQYNLTVEELTAYNNGLPQGLKEGMLLKIPKKIPARTEPKPSATPFQTTQTVNSGTPNKNSGSYKVAMLLPFETERLDSLPKLGHDQIALEFYQGAMIAIDSLREMGVTLDLYIYDTKKDAAIVKMLMTKPELSGVDLFIGPMYKSELMALSDIAGRSGAHIVCPVPQSGGILMNRPYLSKAHCDDATQLKATARFIAGRHSRDNVIVISPTTNTDKLGFNFMAAYNQAKEGQTFATRDSLRKILSDVVTKDMIISKLQPGSKNVIYIGSNQLSYVSGIITKVSELADQYDIDVFGNEDWSRFDQISFNTKSRVNLHLPMASFIDYDSPVVKNFLSHYREKFGTDANKYGFLGYDVTFYYMLGMWRQGRDFFNNLNESGIQLTSTRFKMEKPSEDVGFNNFGAFIVRYRDYKIEIAD
jgi:LysM repeat protein